MPPSQRAEGSVQVQVVPAPSRELLLRYQMGAARSNRMALFWGGITVRQFRLFLAAGTVAEKRFLPSASAPFAVSVAIVLRDSQPWKTRKGEKCEGKASTFSFQFRH